VKPHHAPARRVEIYAAEPANGANVFGSDMPSNDQHRSMHFRSALQRALRPGDSPVTCNLRRATHFGLRLR
jgi:hypothetical protein